jgi:hypothetical protein
MSWWRELLGKEEIVADRPQLSEPPLVANPGRRARPPLAGGLPPDDVSDEPPDKTGAVRVVLHVWCNGKTCSHD